MSASNDKPNLPRVIASTLDAAVGVQSEKNRLRDFQHGSAKAYIHSRHHRNGRFRG